MEKNCQKRRQPLSADSVIARLMGIDELPHQQPLHKYQRVLSNGYICKSACVGLRQGSSFSIGRSRDTNNEILHGVKDARGVKVYKDKNQFAPDKCTSKNTRTVKLVTSNQKPAVFSLSKSTSGVSHEDGKAIVRNSKHGSPGNVLIRYLPKLDNSSSSDQFHSIATGYTNDFFTIQSDRIDKSYSSPCVNNFKSQLVTATNYFGVTKLDLLSRSEIGESSRPESGNIRELTYKQLSDNEIEPPRRSFIDRNRSTNRTSRQQRCRSNLQDLSRLASEGENYFIIPASLASCSGVYDYKICTDGAHLLINKSSLPQETLQKNNEKLMIEKEIEKVEVCGRGQTHVKMEAFAKMEPTPKYLNLRLGRNGEFTQSCKQSINSDSTSRLGIGRIEVWEKDHTGNLRDSEFETTKENLCTSSSGEIKKVQEIFENRCGSCCEQLSSPFTNSSILQSATNIEVSSCYSSRKVSENNTPDVCAKAIQDEMEDSCENGGCREIERGPGVSRLSNNDVVADEEASNGGVFSKISEDQQPESNSVFFPVKDVSSSYSQEASSGEVSLYEFSDEESGYSNCSRLVIPEFQKQLEELTGHCSPDSVLESFYTQHPSNFECFESTGLPPQFQVFNSESEKTYSEGSEMAVSCNEEEKEEGITDLSYNCGKVHRWLGDAESRNFCYLFDVLDGAGCFKERSIIDTIKSWDCLNCPISPLVFEALEKKYCRQACWQKSDRQVLFDLINSWLMTKLKRLLIFHTSATSSLQRHFIAGMNRDEVEDMLWKMVISLEREKNSDASEKVVEGAMKWWEVDDKDINVICRELEISLFEELVMESISLWIE